MPYYIGDVIRDEGTLVARTPEKFREAGIDVRLESTVEAVDAAQGRARLTTGELLPYDALVLATGAEPRLPRGRDSTCRGVPLEEPGGRHPDQGASEPERLPQAVVIGADSSAWRCARPSASADGDDGRPRGDLPVARWDAELPGDPRRS